MNLRPHGGEFGCRKGQARIKKPTHGSCARDEKKEYGSAAGKDDRGVWGYASEFRAKSWQLPRCARWCRRR